MAPPRVTRPDGWPDRVTGELALRVGRRGGRDVAVDQFHTGGLRILRPHYLEDSGQVCYTVINPGGGYLGGDHYALGIDVEPGSSLLLTTQSATRVYRTPGAPARQWLWARVGAGGVLESVPDQLIVYREGEYEQTTHVELDPAGTYIASEIVTPGWAPDGSRFGYRRVLLRTEVYRPGDDVPVLVDAVMLHPSSEDVPGLGGLDGHTHLGSILIVDRRVDAALADAVHDLAGAAQDLRVGMSLLPGPGLVVRVLGHDTESVQGFLLDVDALVRRRWFAQGRIAFRKY